MKIIFFLAALASAWSVRAQTYECRDPATGAIYQQYGVPCPGGRDLRSDKLEQEKQRQRQIDLERSREPKKTPNDYASLRGDVRVGMTRDQVLHAWNTPYQISTQENRDGVREIWHYRCSRVSSTYVYFRNGAVTSINRAC